MKRLILPFTMLSTLAVADDTEIYGANAIDANSRVNSNVMFIMDTSGSMRGSVYTAKGNYSSSTTYSGSYNANEFYLSLSSSSGDGISLSALQSGNSTDCTNAVNTLNSEGRILGGVYEQYRRNRWRSIRRGNNSDIRCDQGDAESLYLGNYLNWYHAPNYIEQSRLDVVRDVVKDLTRSLSNINLGLMRFDSGGAGGLIDVPVGDITTTGPAIRTKLDGYSPGGNTPLTENLHEAALYYRGETWDYGSDSSPNKSVSSSRVSSKYITPITSECQKNHIILLTDGQATDDTDSNGYVKGKVSGLNLPSELSSECSGTGGCLDEIAYWLKNSDHASSYAGTQEITTYTIGGFNLTDGVELLKRTAKWGGGRYYAADNTSELVDALDSIFLDILATDSTFTAPAVSVNAFNSSEHRDELFYALFRPDDNAKWEGNLKKYRLGDGGFVRDKNNTLAISEGTGFFNEGVFDFWNFTNDPDGKNVTKGGMSNLLPASGRTILSEDGGLSGPLITFSNSTNASLLDMEAETAENVEHLKNWIKGIDVDDADGDGSSTDSRLSIGDPLHSEPVVVTYGGTDDNPDSTIFFGTNEGFIHAINTNTGVEEFAFLPRELHKTQKLFYDNVDAAGDRPYGMDGPISIWMKDDNYNNIILNSDGSVEAGEHVYLYAGMRRGGNSYYALNITNRSRPSLLFKIQGGSGDFAKLGQTWSKMTPAKVNFGGSERFVLLFTGGYDENQDSNPVREDDSIGNAIYMVDATTGERLWWASNDSADFNIADMKNSMPTDISAVDITGDGFINYFFAADTGGRIFRFDINPNNSGAGNFAKGGVIADITGNDEANNRRFYNQPNVALVKDKEYGDYLTIAIGTGHRAHPLLTTEVENRFYLIKDTNPYTAPSSYKVKVEAPTGKVSLSSGENADSSLLYNATSLMTNGEDAMSTSLAQLMVGGGGWYVILPNNAEKVLSRSTTFAGAVIFTTFSPSTGLTSGCGADTGVSRVYALDQRWATAALDLDGDGEVEDADASKVLAHSGIAPRPVVIYREDGGKTIAIGTENIDDSRFKQLDADENCEANGTCPDLDNQSCETGNCFVIPTYWRQNPIQKEK